jgi:hypothetical protein
MPSSASAGGLLHFLRIGQGAKNSSGKLTIQSSGILQNDGSAVINGKFQFTPKAAPATCAVGELYVSSVDQKLRLCTATNTWTVVGTQT